MLTIAAAPAHVHHREKLIGPSRCFLRRCAQLSPALAHLPKIVYAVIYNRLPQSFQPLFPLFLINRGREKYVDEYVHRLVDRRAKRASFSRLDASFEALHPYAIARK